MEMTTETRPGGIAIVHITEQLSIRTAASVKKYLTQTVSDGFPRLVVELGSITFVDSSGLTALISGMKAARNAGGDLRIAHPTSEVQRILDLTGLNQIFRAYPTIDEALLGF